MEAHYIGIDIGSTATKLAALSGERALLGTTVVRSRMLKPKIPAKTISR